MIVLLTQFADETSGPGALGINLSAFVIQLLTFLVAFLILRQFAFKPILKMLNERRKTIEEGLTLGEKMQAQEAETEAKVAKELHKARAEADSIIASAHDEAKQIVQSSEETARKRAEQIEHEADEQIKLASARERAKLEQELIGLVSEVSEAVIAEKVDANKDAQLVTKALKDLKGRP